MTQHKSTMTAEGLSSQTMLGERNEKDLTEVRSLNGTLKKKNH